jgi:hypothetical protein
VALTTEDGHAASPSEPRPGRPRPTGRVGTAGGLAVVFAMMAIAFIAVVVAVPRFATADTEV